MSRIRQHLAAGAAAALLCALLTLAGCYVVVPASSNSYLSSLDPAAGDLSPTFSAATTSYTLTIGNAAGGMWFTPTTQDTAATVTVNGESVASGSQSSYVVLNVGTTEFTIVVTAENGSARTYTVDVIADAMQDDFIRDNTSGMDLGPDWTVTGSTGDIMRIYNQSVYTVYDNPANTLGVFAQYNGTVDFTRDVTAAMWIYLPTATYDLYPYVVGGIEVSADSSTAYSGYCAEIDATGTQYQLYLTEYPDSGNSANINIAISPNAWYELQVRSNGTTLTAYLYNSLGTLIQSVGLSDSPRSHTEGSLVFYNYMTNSAPAPLGGALYLDSFGAWYN
jgi:hypothetical protein